MKQPKEDIFDLRINDISLSLAATNAIEELVIKQSSFILASDDKLVGIMGTTLKGIAVTVWTPGEDAIFRMKVDINITHDWVYRIAQSMKDGSERRVDVSLIF